MTERQKFYKSEKWQTFRQIIIDERTDADGFVHCTDCGKAILKRYDIVLHHKKELTEDNVADANIALNPDNVEIVCFKCHNKRHERFGFHKTSAGFRRSAHEVVIVHGSPGSGKSTWVRENASAGDLVVDVDEIWQAVKAHATGIGDKPNGLKPIVFGLRDQLYDMIAHRVGDWDAAFVIASVPRLGDRERLAQRLGADRLVRIDTDRATCAERIAKRSATDEERDKWMEYLATYWEQFQDDGTGAT